MISRFGDYHTGDGPNTGAGGSRGPTAYFPPGYPYFLAGVDLLTGHEQGHKQALGPERLAQALLGTATVGLIGLVALEALGAGPALAAIALASVYPVLVELTGTLVAENLLVALELAACWTALRARRSRRPLAWLGATGALVGLATLTHQNGAVLLLPLGFAATTAAGAAAVGTRARRALAAGLVVVAAALTVLPWTIRNADELHRFIPISDETGITLVGTYNPVAAAFEPVPYKWQYFATLPQEQGLVKAARDYTEPELGGILKRQALHYISAHPLAPLDAALHNTLRMFELEGKYAWVASAQAIGLHVGIAEAGVISFWVLCLLAIAGAFTATARAAPRWLWAVPILFALSVVFVNVETPRFREPIDPFLILLAASAVAAVARRVNASGSVAGLHSAPGLR
jgi:4-amino-4-deoxy-L-arabinose transferase-like glycosyltransferase